MADLAFNIDVLARGQTGGVTSDLKAMLETIRQIDSLATAAQGDVARLQRQMQQTQTRPQNMGGLGALFDASAADVAGRRQNTLLQAARAEVEALRGPAQQVTQQLASGFQGVGHAVEGAKSSVNSFLEFTGAMIFLEVLHKIIEGFEHIGEEVIHAVIEQEHFTNALNFNVGNEGARAFLDYQDQIIDHSLFLQSQTDKWGIELVRAGVPLRDIPLFLAAGEDVAAKSADRVGTMAAMMSKFVEAQRTGFVRGGLGELGIGVDDLKKLPQFAGQTAVEIRKALRQGKFTSSDVLGIVAGMGPTAALGDLAEQASNELGVRLMHLKERPELMFQNLLQSKGFEDLTTAAEHFLQVFDPAGPTGKMIFASLEGAFNSLAKTISGMDAQQVAQAFANAATAAGKLLELLLKVAELVEGPLALFSEKGREDIARGLPGVLGKSAGAMVPGLGLLEAVFDKLTSGPASDDASLSWERVDDPAAAQKAQQAGLILGNNFGGGVETGTREALEIQSPSEVAREIGQMWAAGFGIGVGEKPSDVPQVRGAGGGRGAGAAPQLNLTIQVSGADLGAGNDVDRFVDRLVTVAELRFIEMLERWAAEGGE